MSLVNNITYGRFKFFWSIKNVTFDLLVESGCFDSFAFSFSTSFNTFNLSLYTSNISKVLPRNKLTKTAVNHGFTAV
jgi:hypothetical protein